MNHTVTTELLATISRSSEGGIYNNSVYYTAQLSDMTAEIGENGTHSPMNDRLKPLKSISLQAPLIENATFYKHFSRKWKRHSKRPKNCKWRVFPKDKETNSTSVSLPNNKPILAMCITTDAKV